MKHLFFIPLISLFVACSTAQNHYSISNKKAIKLFEQAQQEPRTSIDTKTKQPNYVGGINLLQKAIEKEPKFWEAHLLAGEYFEYIGKFDNAIAAYETALQINPNHSTSGSTFFFLANLQHATGQYEKSIRNLDIFTLNKNANPQLVAQANSIRGNCEFAIQALKKPRNFEPKNIGPGINTKDPEYFPTITVDGKTILFTRRIYDAQSPFKEQEDFFVSHLNDKGIWETAQPMPSNVNTVLNEGAPTISADGRTLIFVACSDQSGNNVYGENRIGKGSCDLFLTKKLGTVWSNPINLPGSVNTGSWESQPSLSADGKSLYFIKRVSRRGEPIDSDIFVSYKQDDEQWGKPERLPMHINTPFAEESVLIHPDGQTLYFASRGHKGMGGSDLFVCRKDPKGNWSKPENLGYPINTIYDENSLMVSADGEIAFFASDRKGGYGDLDIYYFTMPEDLRPTKTLYFDGVVYDQLTRKPLAGKFQLVNLQTGEEVVVAEADKVTGEFLVSLPINQEYALNVSFPGYSFFSKNFNMQGPEGQKSVHMDVPMLPVSSSEPVLLANVFFDLGKSTLRNESHVELNKLFDFLVANPRLKIEIGGHTDTRGNDKENLILSTDRAKSVVDYLKQKGIPEQQLLYKGYGELNPVVSDEEIAKLAEENEKEAAHQSNRRTEYKILK